MLDALARSRDSLARRSWTEAYALLRAADREAPLAAADLERLAMVARLIGLEDEAEEILTRAHGAFLAGGDPRGAARCAVWLGFELLTAGELARAGGWLARARRLLDELPAPCVEHGLALVPAGIRALREGDIATARAHFVAAGEIARGFGDVDLATLALHGEGRALVAGGDITRGTALLDEAMVAVTAGETTPLVAGGVYCSVIEVCADLLDLARARQWTTALDRWCATQPDALLFRGHCLLRHAELLQFDGAWPEARREAERARDRLLEPRPRAAASGAFLRLAELARLTGDFAAAEDLYAQAGGAGHVPHAGLALLRLAQDRPAEARDTIERVLEQERAPAGRARALDACVEIALVTGSPARARAAAEELSGIARRVGAPLLLGMAQQCEGAVRLAAGDGPGALAALREAWQTWRNLELPYEEARTRVGLAQACRALGNGAGAEVELDAARATFAALGALPDLARLDALRDAAPPSTGARGPTLGLTAREAEVVALVATGATNRAIGERLFISEKTVARHLANVFDKLDLGSRAALTAWAYEHGLAPR